MKVFKKPERDLKKFLRTLSDKQIKKWVDGIDVSPFPMLLAAEYRRRFGLEENAMKRIKIKLGNRIRNEQQRQGILLGDVKKDLKIIMNSTVSPTGIADLSERSINQIHVRRISALEEMRRSLKMLAKSTMLITRLENELADLHK